MSEKKSVKVKDDVTARKRLIEQEVQNKVYYDVSIKYNPEEVDNMYGFYSKAETEITHSIMTWLFQSSKLIQSVYRL